VREDRSSDTALGVTAIRAVHQLIDEVPHILEDPVSLRLLDPEAVRAIREKPENHRSLPSRALRSHVVLRSRYAEDELSRAAASGITQFVSIGAGYDTFSSRQPPWARHLKIAELDHPATRSAKIELFRKCGIETPGNTVSVPVDLESGEVRESLANTSLDFGAPVFVACLGVLAYLRLETVRRVFRSVAAMPTGSVFALAFAPKQTESSTAADKAAAHGEPWLTRLDLDDLRAELLESGFRAVSFLRPEEAAAKYYPGRRDLPPPRKTRICRADV
jgi:methyltransferase (TIGR00027 family)